MPFPLQRSGALFRLVEETLGPIVAMGKGRNRLTSEAHALAFARQLVVMGYGDSRTCDRGFLLEQLPRTARVREHRTPAIFSLHA